MKTKAPEPESLAILPRMTGYSRTWKIFCVTILVLNIFAVSSVAYLYSTTPDKVAFADAVLRMLHRVSDFGKTLDDYPKAISYYLKAQLTSQDTIHIDMKHVDLQKIEYTRQKALQNDKDFEFVPAVIHHDNKKYKVKMRLKGDREIHFDDLDTASYRVKIKGDNTLFGMKTFSMHKPRARNHTYEWIYLRLMDYAGIMSPQYRFVNVNFNGKDLGLYALEEHYDKYLIERHRKREAPIIRLKEDAAGAGWINAAIEPYLDKKWNAPKNRPITKKATNLLEGYRSGDLTVSQVFDVEKLAMFFALTDLTGMHHGSVPKSLRFYYNPMTSRLEPIPFDGHFGTISRPMLSSEMSITPGTWIYRIWPEWFAGLFNNPDRIDPVFIRAYVAALGKVSSTEYLDKFFEDIADELDQAILSTYSEMPLKDNISSFGPAPYIFDTDVFYQRSQYIKRRLSLSRINAYLTEQTDKQLILDISNSYRQLPVEIVSIKCGKTVLMPETESIYLISVNRRAEFETHRIHFPIKAEQAAAIKASECDRIYFRTPGTDNLESAEINPWTRYDHKFVSADIGRAEPNYAEFDFIDIDAKNKELHISPGKHSIKRNLILPSGFAVIAGPGTTLNLLDGALIYSHSPLQFTGTEDGPIEITSPDHSGQGIAVISASGRSHLEQVKFTHLRNPNQLGWTIPGAVTFYESPVDIISVSVTNNQSEDAINIVRSPFKIRQLTVADTYSDGIDVDFSEGSIHQSRFFNTGNDGLDFSGSTIALQDIEVLSAGDKGVSVGEASRVDARNITVRQSIVGVASKDNSVVKINHLDIKDTALALVAFQKKSEYGPGSIAIEQFNHDGRGKRSLIERGSMLMIDEQAFSGKEKDVEKQLSALTKLNSRNEPLH